MKGKIAAKKKAEITEAMKQAAALVHSYVPPDPQRIQATKAAGNLAVVPTGPDSIRLDLRSYAKSGDTLSLGLDTARNAIQTVSVKSYLESEKEPVTLEVTFARLREGLSYPGNVVLSVPEAEDPGGGPELQLRASDTGGDDGGQAGRGRARLDGRGFDDRHRHPDRTHRALPGCPDGPDPGGLDRLRGPPEALRLDGPEREPQGKRAPGRRREGGLRSLLHRTRAVSPGGQDDGREARLDEGARQGLRHRSKSRARFDPAPAGAGAGAREPQDHAAAGGRDGDDVHRGAGHRRFTPRTPR